MLFEVVILLIVLVIILAGLLRWSVVKGAERKQENKRLREQLDALTEKNRVTHEVRREPNEALLDRISPSDR
jgi:hypothetical protein